MNAIRLMGGSVGIHGMRCSKTRVCNISRNIQSWGRFLTSRKFSPHASAQPLTTSWACSECRYQIAPSNSKAEKWRWGRCHRDFESAVPQYYLMTWQWSLGDRLTATEESRGKIMIILDCGCHRIITVLPCRPSPAALTVTATSTASKFAKKVLSRDAAWIASDFRCRP